MYQIEKIKDKLETTLKDRYLQYNPQVQISQDLNRADLTTNLAFKLAKDLHIKPEVAAQQIIDYINSKEEISKFFVEIKSVSGFVNFRVSFSFLFKNLLDILSLKDGFGKTDLYKGKLFEVEHTSPNPNKSMHLGHLRNNVVSMAITNIFEFNGAKVIRDAIDNNRGIAIAKLMWGYLKFARKDGAIKTDLKYWFNHQDEWLTPEDTGESPDRFMDKYYVKGANDFKENPEVEQRVRQMVVDWENEDKLTWELWKRVLDYVYEGQKRTLDRLASKWDKVWHEHEHYKLGKKFVEQGLKQGIFRKTDQGTIITNLEKYHLPDTVVIKSDGTSLYITQDIALTYLKKQTYKADKMFWVIGPEQSLAMKQLFAVCEQLGFGKFEDFIHIAYGYMSIKGQGKMSSRAGNVVYIDDLLDQAKEYFKDILKDRDIVEAKKDEIAEKLAIASVKYSILKVSRMRDLAFDFKTSVSFEGNSGPYIMYVYVRIMSLLKRARKDVRDILEDLASVTKVSMLQIERRILFKLMTFPIVVKDAAREYEPSFIADYIYKLSQLYTKFYDSVPILNEDKEDKRILRLAMSASTAIVLKNGFGLLGIKTVDQM